MAHELHHFEQHRRMEWRNLSVNAAEQIFVEHIGEAAADTACYQYLYDVKDNPDAKEAVENARSPWALGGRQYFNAKAAGKSEGECVLDAMGGYASSVSNAESYAKNYHRGLFWLQQNNIDYWVDECDPAEMDGNQKFGVEKCLSDAARTGEKVDEVSCFKRLTTGLMSELPAVEKAKTEPKTPRDINADCLAAGDDGTALRLLWQKENNAFRAKVSGLYGQFKQNEAAARDDVKNKKEAERGKNAALGALENVGRTAGLMRSVVDDWAAIDPAGFDKNGCPPRGKRRTRLSPTGRTRNASPTG